MQLKQLDVDSASEAKKDGEGREWSAGGDLANGELPGTVILPAGWYAQWLKHMRWYGHVMSYGEQEESMHVAACGLRGCQLQSSDNTKYLLTEGRDY